MAPQVPGLEQLPDWLVDMVLGHIPKGDPEAMRRAADAWAESADALVPVLHRLRAASAQLDKAVEGETGAAMREQYRKLIAHTEAQIEFCNSMARPLYDNATAVQEQIYVIYLIGLALLSQVAVSMMMPPPGSIMKLMADRLETKAAMQVSQRGFLVATVARALRLGVEHQHLVLAAKGVFFGAAVGGGAPYVAQRKLIEQGHLEKVDWRKVKIGMAAGAVGGLAGVEVGRRVAPAAIRAGGRVLGTVAAGGVGGMAGGLAGGVTAWGLTGGELRGKDLAAMVWTGFGSGLVGSVGAAVRPMRAGAYTGAPEPVVPGSGLSPDGAPMPSVSATGDGQPPQVRTATSEATSTASYADPPPAKGSGPEIGDGSAPRRPDLTSEMMAEGEQIFRDLFDNAPVDVREALVAFRRGDSPGPSSDGSDGTTPPGNTPNHPSAGPSHPTSPSSPGRGGSFPAWSDTPVARSSVAVASPSESGPATPMPTRQAHISDPQVRPDQRGVGVITEGTVTQSDNPAITTEYLHDGSSSFRVEHGRAGDMRLVTAPEQTATNAPENATGLRPTGETLNEGTPSREEQTLLDLDFEAGFARLQAELAANQPPASADTAAPSVHAPKATDVPPPPPTATDNIPSPANTGPVPDGPPAPNPGMTNQSPGTATGVPSPRIDTAPPAAPEPRNAVAQPSTAKAPEASRSTPPPSTAEATSTTPGTGAPKPPTPPPSTPDATSSTPHTGAPKPPTGPTPPTGAHSAVPFTVPLAPTAFSTASAGTPPDVPIGPESNAPDPTAPTSATTTPPPAAGFTTTNTGETPHTAAPPPAPTAAAGSAGHRRRTRRRARGVPDTAGDHRRRPSRPQRVERPQGTQRLARPSGPQLP
ncbi:hypothetical protein ACRS6B_07265 [Nocardia asteroides]